MVRRLAAIRCKPPHFFVNYPRIPGKCVDTNVTRVATCVAKDEQSLKPLRLFRIILTIEGFGCASDKASFMASMVSRAACCLSASSSLADFFRSSRIVLSSSAVAPFVWFAVTVRCPLPWRLRRRHGSRNN